MKRRTSWNKGLKGKKYTSHFKNKWGGFQKGNLPHNTGKTKDNYKSLQIVSEKLKGRKVSKDTRIKLGKSIRINHLIQRKKIIELQNYYKKYGFKVWTPFQVIPDLIIRKGNKLISIEIGDKKSKRLKERTYKNKGVEIFDKLIYSEVKGVKL